MMTSPTAEVHEGIAGGGPAKQSGPSAPVGSPPCPAVAAPKPCSRYPEFNYCPLRGEDKHVSWHKSPEQLRNHLHYAEIPKGAVQATIGPVSGAVPQSHCATTFGGVSLYSRKARATL